MVMDLKMYHETDSTNQVKDFSMSRDDILRFKGIIYTCSKAQ